MEIKYQELAIRQCQIIVHELSCRVHLSGIISIQHPWKAKLEKPTIRSRSLWFTTCLSKASWNVRTNRLGRVLLLQQLHLCRHFSGRPIHDQFNNRDAMVRAAERGSQASKEKGHPSWEVRRRSGNRGGIPEWCSPKEECRRDNVKVSHNDW